MPLPNQQPEWLNAPANSDSTASQSDSSAINSNSGRTIYVDLNHTPKFVDISWVPNPPPDAGITLPIVCQKHRATIRETITIHIDGTRDETYCLACIRDLLKERLLPINQAQTTDSTSSNVPRFSRYDLLKGKNA